jgi:hypothetical protein
MDLTSLLASVSLFAKMEFIGKTQLASFILAVR